MNLLDSASLVVTPNGYKASKLYSIIPSDGSGDMTFARTGNTATRVNASGLIEPINANIPRLDYLGGGCPKLLLEPQRTNLLLRSEEFDNASWLKDNGGAGSIPVVTANNAISPDGTQDADLIVFNLNGGTASGDLSYVGQTATTTVSTTYTFTIYAKTSDNSTKVMSLVNGNGVFTLITITSSWQRFSITYTASLTTSNIRLRLRGSASGEATSTSASIHIWGAQLEAGAYATSYIPTTTASVTRNADSCTKTSISSLIGQTEGTIFVDVNYDSNKIDTNGVLVPLVLSQSTTNSEITLYKTGRVQATHRNSGTLTCNIDLTSYGLTNSRHKIAFAYKLNDFVLYIDGVLAGSDTVGTVGAQDSISLKDTTFPSIGLTNSVALWKTRLTNQELVTLTSL